MSEMVTSAGQVGFDFNRSEGRAYLTLANTVDSHDSLSRSYVNFKVEAGDAHRRRWVMRSVIADEEIRIDAGHSNTIEVDVPLYLIEPGSRRRMLIMAENVHRSTIDPEFGDVYYFWTRPYQKEINPTKAVTSLPEQFRLTRNLTLDDLIDLWRIWSPFGWKLNGVGEFITTYRQKDNLWFSGVRDTSTGKLVSACQGEGITFADLFLVEGTEYGTLPSFEGRNFCTAAVAGLHAQILSETLYQGTQTPLIYSELNMTTRSDVIARKIGMTIPLVEGGKGVLWRRRRQVLRRNVSVRDNRPPNDLKLEEIENEYMREQYRAAYGDTYMYWRNFIAGILPLSAIERYYSPAQCQQIMEAYNG